MRPIDKKYVDNFLDARYIQNNQLDNWWNNIVPG